MTLEQAKSKREELVAMVNSMTCDDLKVAAMNELRELDKMLSALKK